MNDLRSTAEDQAPATESAAPASESPAQAAESSPTVDASPTPVATANTPPAVADLSPSACAARLVELFPAVFTPGAPKPLKLRIQADVQQRAPGVFTRKALSVFLHRHTTSTAYLRALADAADRIDLDGLPAGPVDDEHRQAAATELQRRRALHDERRAAERDAQRKAHDERRAGEREAQRAAHDAHRATHDEARRSRAAEGQALSERAALLRAFEATTLTAANFCALKGLSESDLAAALAQAREDRQRFAQAPRPQQPETRPAERDPRTRSQPSDGRPAEGEPRTAHRQQPDRRPRGVPKPPR
ncbi:MAG: prop effector ProQ [Methylibium sp.]|uniref:ProQ/FINO family protein n=1 Tax=Methylibium sp. TaxID=2067992 RepID=UPI00179BC2C3|nr:ProQ/FINO family protein [Methylibium sp.]MBA3598130.1 prop effector ProQ [Methylibium sp.]